MKILFIGDDWVGSNARSMADGFRQAGHEVVVVDTTPVTLPTRLSPAWVYSKAMRRRAPWLQESAHRQIERIAQKFGPDMLFGFKTIHLDQARLLQVPAAVGCTTARTMSAILTTRHPTTWRRRVVGILW